MMVALVQTGCPGTGHSNRDAGAAAEATAMPRLERATRSLVTALDADNPYDAECALIDLRGLEGAPSATLDAVLRAARHPSADIRAGALFWLTEKAPERVETAATLRAALASDESSTRVAGFYALEALGERAHLFFADVARALRVGRSGNELIAAAIALRHVGYADEEILLCLVKGLHHESPWARVACAQALEELRAPLALCEDALTRVAVDDGHEEVRRAARNALATLRGAR